MTCEKGRERERGGGKGDEGDKERMRKRAALGMQRGVFHVAVDVAAIYSTLYF